jgi:hypothetical protein
MTTSGSAPIRRTTSVANNAGLTSQLHARGGNGQREPGLVSQPPGTTGQGRSANPCWHGLVNRMRWPAEWVLNTLPPGERRAVARRRNGTRSSRPAAMGFRAAFRASLIPSSCRRTVSRSRLRLGPDYDHSEASGVPPTRRPDQRVIKMLAAGGQTATSWAVLTARRAAGDLPGWNITAGPGDPYDGRPFHAGQVATTSADGPAKTSARPPPVPAVAGRALPRWLCAAVKAAADNAACQGYLLAGPAAAAMGAKCTTVIPAGFQDDWKALVDAAIASNVCNQSGDGGMCNPGP